MIADCYLHKGFSHSCRFVLNTHSADFLQCLKGLNNLVCAPISRLVHTLTVGIAQCSTPFPLPSFFAPYSISPVVGPAPALPSEFIDPTWCEPDIFILPLEAKTDIKNRKRKMKTHQKRIWRKTHVSYIQKRNLQQRTKEENKLQQLFEFWRKRSDAWDPEERIATRLRMARRSGFYVDILNRKFFRITHPNADMAETTDFTSISNPISASRRGQEALQDLLSGLRDLMLPFYACMDPKKRSFVSTHQALAAAQQCSDTINQMRANRDTLRETFELVKENCANLLDRDPASMIPYADEVSATVTDSSRPDLRSLLETREQLSIRYKEVTAELENLKHIITGAIWDLNDLMDPMIVGQ
ncbi:unnamed protein product [Dicrocoelium dendriticum]|nr:unnamed protein product [Dicrocoelium dendriticum]